jgi:hypothetical protein
MPSYTGTGRTRIYLCNRALQDAAKNNAKITTFFQPAAQPPPTPSLSRATSQSPTIISDCPSQTPSCDTSPTRTPTSPPITLAVPNLEPELAPVGWEPDSKSELGPELVESQVNDANSKTPLVSFLDMTGDDNSAESNTDPVLETIRKLMVDAKKYKSFTSLFYLNTLKQFIELWGTYQCNPKIRAPMCKASHAVATSIGKGPYMARKIRALYRYVVKF